MNTPQAPRSSCVRSQACFSSGPHGLRKGMSHRAEINGRGAGGGQCQQGWGWEAIEPSFNRTANLKSFPLRSVSPGRQHWVRVQGSKPHSGGNSLLGGCLHLTLDTQVRMEQSFYPSSSSYREVKSSVKQPRGFRTKVCGSFLLIHKWEACDPASLPFSSGNEAASGWPPRP